jgi:hypothetical protein
MQMRRTFVTDLLLGPLAAIHADQPLSHSSPRMIYIFADDAACGGFNCYGQMTLRSLKQP